LKNIKLKKLDSASKEEVKDLTPLKNEVVPEHSGNVSHLRSLFEGGSRKKAMAESIKKVEADLKKGAELAKESLAQAEAQIEELTAKKDTEVKED
jgi:vacuolar-type H+-ATPase subunit I/STV1